MMAFNENGLKDKVKVIVNRAGLDNGQISLKKAQETIGREIFWQLPNDYRTMVEVRNNGVPLIEQAPKAAITQSILQMAQALSESEKVADESRSDQSRQEGRLDSILWGEEVAPPSVCGSAAHHSIQRLVLESAGPCMPANVRNRAAASMSLAYPEELRTQRLLLRRWCEADRAPFAAMNADPRVMEHFPKTLSRGKRRGGGANRSALRRAWLRLMGGGDQGCRAVRGVHWSMPTSLRGALYAVRRNRLAAGGGVLGPRLCHRGPEPRWRLAFKTLGLDEIVSFTVPANVRSRRVMEKLGMTQDPADDFDHPLLAEGSPLRRHVLYRLRILE